MHRQDIIGIIFEAIDVSNHAREDGAQVPKQESTSLYGAEGYLDSMALVSLLIDIEDACMERGIEITLSDERAMSQKNSPFRSVATLADYIESLTGASS